MKAAIVPLRKAKSLSPAQPAPATHELVDGFERRTKGIVGLLQALSAQIERDPGADTSTSVDDISKSGSRISEPCYACQEANRTMRSGRPRALLAGTESLAEQAYRVIRERILTGEYSLGTVIPRRELAASLGMSIVPVNDALARLEHEYLIENAPRVGTRVRIPTPRDLRGFWAVREGLETQSARLFVRTATNKERGTLVEMAAELDRLHELSTKGDEPDAKLLYKWRCAHMQFHMYIAECTQLPFLSRAIERNQLLVFSWFYDHQLYGGQRLPPRWHEQLARTLAQNSEEAADRATREHLHNRLEELMRRLERFLMMDESHLMAAKDGKRPVVSLR